jgi:hypothetical protein
VDVYLQTLSDILISLKNGFFISDNIWKTQMKMELMHDNLNIRKACRESTGGKVENLLAVRRSLRVMKPT